MYTFSKALVELSLDTNAVNISQHYYNITKSHVLYLKRVIRTKILGTEYALDYSKLQTISVVYTNHIVQ